MKCEQCEKIFTKIEFDAHRSICDIKIPENKEKIGITEGVCLVTNEEKMRNDLTELQNQVKQLYGLMANFEKTIRFFSFSFRF